MLLEEAVMLSAPVAPKDRRHPGGAGAKRAVQGGWWRRQLPLRAFTLCPSPPSPIRPGGHPPPPKSAPCSAAPHLFLDSRGITQLTLHIGRRGYPTLAKPLSGRAGTGSAGLHQNPPGSPGEGCCGGGGGGEGRAGPAQPGSCRQKAGRRQAGGRHEAGRRRCSPVPASRRCPAPVAVQRLRAAAGEEQAERGGSRAGDRDAFAFQETQQREIQSLRAEEKVSVSVSGSPVSSRAKE